MENNQPTMDMDLHFLMQENGDGQQLAHQSQVHLVGVGDLFMMELILLDVDMDQISSQLKQEPLLFQKRNMEDTQEDMEIMESIL